ncbi:MAG: pyridoxal-phosphate-dependent aminotransferase family protein [Trebonia sp.]
MEFNLSAGPSGATPATLAALSRPVMNHQDPVFAEFYEETAELLRRAFGTERTPVILQGEAVLGLEAAAASAIGAGDVVLNLVSGLYGRYYGDWARRYAREVIDLEVPFNSSVPATAVAEALSGRPDVTVVTVVHCDTPSGTVNDLDAISTVVKNHGALLIVDAVSTFGGMPCDFDGWGAALVVTAPQKCLGGPPGLSLLHVSDAAWEHMAANPAAPRGSILSILDWREAHRAGVRFPFTPSVTDIYGLRSCVEQYLAEGPAAVHARHRAAARAAQAGTQALGLELWAGDPAVRSDTATAIRMPAGIDERDIRVRARAESGVTLSEGVGDMAGIVLRIGHMGPNAYPMGPVIALTAIGRALRGAGAKADIGAAVEAAIAAADSA